MGLSSWLACPHAASGTMSMSSPGSSGVAHSVSLPKFPSIGSPGGSVSRSWLIGDSLQCGSVLLCCRLDPGVYISGEASTISIQQASSTSRWKRVGKVHADCGLNKVDLCCPGILIDPSYTVISLTI